MKFAIVGILNGLAIALIVVLAEESIQRSKKRAATLYATNRITWAVSKSPMISVPISIADVGTNRILIEVAEEGTNIVTYINGKAYGTNHLGDNFYKAISATHDRNLSLYMEEDMPASKMQYPK